MRSRFCLVSTYGSGGAREASQISPSECEGRAWPARGLGPIPGTARFPERQGQNPSDARGIDPGWLKKTKQNKTDQEVTFSALLPPSLPWPPLAVKFAPASCLWGNDEVDVNHLSHARQHEPQWTPVAEALRRGPVAGGRGLAWSQAVRCVVL